MAAMASRWFLRNVSQRWLESGGELRCARYRDTVDSEISNPNFMRSRSSEVIVGRPRRRRERKRQYRRKPARCQPTTVSGFTISNALAHFDHQRRRPSQKRRSQSLNWGRGFLRLRTPTCCRKATSSSPRSYRERKNTPNQERKTRRNRIMGPVYRMQSTGRRVPASYYCAKQSDFEDTRFLP